MGLVLVVALAALAVLVVSVTSASAAPVSNSDPMPENSTDPIVLPAVKDLARAIARAEGFGATGVIPTRAHNPGDLVIPGWTGETLGTERISVFASDADGWRALYRQLQRMADGRSRVYDLTDTIAAMGVKWTGGDRAGAWVANVVTILQGAGYDVSAESTLADVFGLVL